MPFTIPLAPPLSKICSPQGGLDPTSEGWALAAHLATVSGGEERPRGGRPEPGPLLDFLGPQTEGSHSALKLQVSYSMNYGSPACPAAILAGDSDVFNWR